MIVSTAVRMLTIQIIITIPFLRGSNAPLNNIGAFFLYPVCGYVLVITVLYAKLTQASHPMSPFQLQRCRQTSLLFLRKVISFDFS